MSDLYMDQNFKANDAWIRNLNDTMSFGHDVSPRGVDTKETIEKTVSFDMNFPICYHQSRKLSYRFMAAEAYWITSGSMFVEDIAPYNSHIGQFSDDDYIFNGNYGVPYIHQLNYVVNTLIEDINSRQAVMTIWRPNPIQTKDYPCTVDLMFNIRDNKLNCAVHMRSQDLWLGQPYDFFNFTIMALGVLTMYNSKSNKPFVELGLLHHSGFSTHIYKQNFDSVNMVLDSKPDKVTSKVPKRCLVDWNYVKKSLLACRDNKDTSYKDVWQIRP